MLAMARFASGLHTKMQNPADESGACELWSRKEGAVMALLVLTVVLVLLRMRRIRLKIELDL
jgi:hypothetical protein